MSTPAETFRWTVGEYHRAVETGFFRPDERFELIDGELITMVPVNPPHAQTVGRLDRMFQAHLDPNEFTVRIQQPLNLGADCQPEPDVTVVRGPESRYETRHPSPSDVLLAIEVADTTAAYDREAKLPLYARHGLSEVWLVDINRREILISRQPSATGYQTQTTHTAGSVPTPVNIAIDINAVLPPARM